MNKIVTDFDIQALLDGELNARDTQRVKTYLRENHYAQKRYEELKKQRSYIRKWWAGKKNKS